MIRGTENDSNRRPGSSHLARARGIAARTMQRRCQHGLHTNHDATAPVRTHLPGSDPSPRTKAQRDRQRRPRPKSGATMSVKHRILNVALIPHKISRVREAPAAHPGLKQKPQELHPSSPTQNTHAPTSMASPVKPSSFPRQGLGQRKLCSRKSGLIRRGHLETRRDSFNIST